MLKYREALPNSYIGQAFIHTETHAHEPLKHLLGQSQQRAEKFESQVVCATEFQYLNTDPGPKDKGSGFAVCSVVLLRAKKL